MYGKAVIEEVNRLKAQPGKAIEISGAVLATALMQAGLSMNTASSSNP